MTAKFMNHAKQKADYACKVNAERASWKEFEKNELEADCMEALFDQHSSDSQKKKFV